MGRLSALHRSLGCQPTPHLRERAVLGPLSAVDAFRSRIDDTHRRMGGRLEVAVFDKTASNPAAYIGVAMALFAEQAPGWAATGLICYDKYSLWCLFDGGNSRFYAKTPWLGCAAKCRHLQSAVAVALSLSR